MLLPDPRNKNQELAQNGQDLNVQNEPVYAKAPKSAKIFFYFVFGVLGIFWFLWIGPVILTVKKRNWFNKMQMRINEAVSGIDIQLQKRRDTLTKMVDAASSSAKFEKGLLEEVTKMRQTKNFDQTTTEGQQNKSTLDRLFAQVEAYPNVKSVQAFVELMDAADYQEREIAATRRIYNSLATEFNQQLFVFYGNVIATKKHLYTYPMFAASDEAKKDVSLKISV